MNADYLTLLAWVLFGISVVQSLILIAQLPVAYRELRHQSQANELESSRELCSSVTQPMVSVIMPAYNEEDCIVRATRSLLRLRYQNLQVVVVNDGSRDGTLAALKAEFDLQPTQALWHPAVPCEGIREVYGSVSAPRLLVVDKMPSGSKSGAANAGLNVAMGELVCLVDADSLVEEDALARTVRPFVEDRTMVAVGATIRLLNGCEVQSGRVASYRLPKRFIEIMQVLEYTRAFIGARLALSRWSCVTLVSGAFGLLKRDVVIAVGGYKTDTLGEDYELVMAMHQYLLDRQEPYAMRYLADTVCWTEAPRDLRDLATQRRRWGHGALQVFSRYKHMIFKRQFGRVGTLALPLALFYDVVGPIVELVGFVTFLCLLALGLIDWSTGWAFIALLIVLGTINTQLTLMIDVNNVKWRLPAWERRLLIGYALLENLGYRQLTGVFRMVAVLDFIRGRSSWGRIARHPQGAVSLK